MLHIHGTVISTYTRIISTVAEEAGLAWTVHATPADSPENHARHPFHKVPTVEWEGRRMYESVGICTWIDRRHPGCGLIPGDAEAEARMHQWISIGNQYVFPTLEHGLVLPRLVVPLMGREPDEALIRRALPTIAYQLDVITARLEETPWLAGADVSLADIFLYCMVRPVELTPEGPGLIDPRLPLVHWLRRMEQRSSIQRTRWPAEAAD